MFALRLNAVRRPPTNVAKSPTGCRELRVADDVGSTAVIVELLQGHYPLALQLAEKDTDPEAREMALAIVYSALGKPEDSKQALERLLRVPMSEYSVAAVHAYQGEKDVAFRSLEAAYQQHRPDLLGLKTDPLLTRLRTDERYKGLLRRMNLPE